MSKQDIKIGQHYKYIKNSTHILMKIARKRVSGWDCLAVEISDDTWWTSGKTYHQDDTEIYQFWELYCPTVKNIKAKSNE